MISRILAIVLSSLLLAASSVHAAPATYPLVIGKKGELAGPGADILRPEIARAQFILYGQDEGFADAAIVLRALAREARPFGFHTLAVEAGPYTTETVVRALSSKGMPDATAMLRRSPLASMLSLNSAVELALISDFVDRDVAGAPHVWGIDYEAPGSMGLLLERLRTLAPDATARAVVDKWAAEEADTKRPFLLLSKSDADFKDLAAHFAGIPEAQHIIASARESAVIYRIVDRFLFQARRADMIRENFLHFYRNAGGQPKIIAIMGTSHLGLGITGNATMDIGTLATCMAVLNGHSALRIAFLPANDPLTDNRMRKSHPYYLRQHDDPDPKILYNSIGIDPNTLARDGWTLIPLASIRARLLAKGMDGLRPEVRFHVLGYDYLITTPVAKPATPIQ